MATHVPPANGMVRHDRFVFSLLPALLAGIFLFALVDLVSHAAASAPPAALTAAPDVAAAPPRPGPPAPAAPPTPEPPVPAVPALSAASIDPSPRPLAALSPRMHAALQHVARRYRVAPAALRPIFEAAEICARERSLDPLLIVAVIGVESSFNPFSESTMGALGLMQVMPRFHQEKLPAGAGSEQFLDPVINVRVGAHVLEESIRRRGDLVAGLQQFGGAIHDERQTYANKVLAEKARLEAAASTPPADG